MSADRIVVDSLGYNALGSSCAKSSWWGQAFHVLEQMAVVQLQAELPEVLHLRRVQEPLGPCLVDDGGLYYIKLPEQFGD